jgi:hypothetical protein
MNVGITGHQRRESIDWDWVEQALKTELQGLGEINLAVTSLAIGTDQVFAEAALSLGITVRAIIPTINYERFFTGRALTNYRTLLGLCEVVTLKCTNEDQECFWEAGKFIVRFSDVMIAVWDGKNSAGKGGTADVVQYAQSIRKSVIHINPVSRTVFRP